MSCLFRSVSQRLISFIDPHVLSMHPDFIANWAMFGAWSKVIMMRLMMKMDLMRSLTMMRPSWPVPLSLRWAHWGWRPMAAWYTTDRRCENDRYRNARNVRRIELNGLAHDEIEAWCQRCFRSTRLHSWSLELLMSAMRMASKWCRSEGDWQAGRHSW